MRPEVMRLVALGPLPLEDDERPLEASLALIREYERNLPGLEPSATDTEALAFLAVFNPNEDDSCFGLARSLLPHLRWGRLSSPPVAAYRGPATRVYLMTQTWRPGAREMPMFMAIVDGVFPVRGRGIVVLATLTDGQEPRVGMLVAIQATGRSRIVAEVRGVETGVRPPRFAVLLRDVAAKAVPVGARMTEASA